MEVWLLDATKAKFPRQMLVQKASYFIQEPQDLGEGWTLLSKTQSIFSVEDQGFIGIGRGGIFFYPDFGTLARFWFPWGSIHSYV